MTTEIWPEPGDTVAQEATPLFQKIITKERPLPLLTPDEDADVPQTDVWDGRHAGTVHFKELFKFDHLSDGPHKLVSQRCAALAVDMVTVLPDGPELTAGLRKLWEAKNSFVVQAARFSGETVAPNRGDGR